MPGPLPYPALHATHGGIWIATPDGAVRALSRGEAIARTADTPTIILNAPLVAALHAGQLPQQAPRPFINTLARASGQGGFGRRAA